ncbi:MAG: hypothetical protein K0B05_01495 [Bacteroidales bacterium]|nr:hypothetical protein [Bacteroidales bacterium]
MKNYTFLLLAFLIIPALLPCEACAQPGSVRQVKLTSFELQSSSLIDDDGEILSTTGYSSPVYWFPVTVPSTVLTGLVANNVYPDPYSGLNNMLIPDASDEFKGSPDWPLEGEVFRKNVMSTILRIRNHPSLLVWTGGNEGHARQELYDFMRNSIISHDGTRPFIPSSSGFAKLPEGWAASWPDNLPGGVYSGGPYTWRDPKDYYRRAIAGRDWVFKDETGIPSMPPYNILPRIIPDLVWDKTLPFPLNHTWGYHDAATGNGRWDLYYREMVNRYGEAESMEEFCDKMQLMNAMGYQGIFEAAGHKLNDIGGVMLWKLNAAFPSVVWQVYDWFLQPNAGYYFMQNACEPLHVQLNLSDYMVAAVNRRYKPAPGLTVTATLFSNDLKPVFNQSVVLSLSPSEVKEAISLAPEIEKIKGVTFVVLKLKDGTGKTISNNTYWLSSDGDSKAMNEMKETEVNVIARISDVRNTEKVWNVEISNPSDMLAFFIRAQLMDGPDEILPTYWSGNYITLAPGDSVKLTVSCPVSLSGGGSPRLRVSGWNVKESVVTLEKD